MSLNMYLGEVQSQTQSMNAVCTAIIQGMEEMIQSIDVFAVDTVLQGQTYSSAKSYFVQTFRPLAQGIIYLCEELIRQNNAFPNNFQSQVASTDVIEQEILEQIREIDQMIASTEAINQTMPMPSMDAMVNLFAVMRRKLQEKLEHLYEFNYTSSSNYDTALQLAANIAQGLAEVQSGKGFSPASGTFSTQGLNMEWTTSIQAITEERARQAANSIEEGAICDKIPEKSTGEKILDGIVEGAGQAVEDTIEGFKALGKWETWENMGNALLDPIDTLSTMYNVLSDSFINDVINGDAESRAKWGSYALTQVVLGLIGDKGISKVTTLAKGAKFSPGMLKATQLFNKGDNFAFAGGSDIRFGFDNFALRQAEETLSPYQLTKGTGEALGNKEVAVGEEIIAQSVLKAELDLTPKLTPYKSLSRGQQKKIKEKIENRTVTKEEYKRYQWDKRFSKRRAAGVNEFWKQEKKRILDGEPTTRDWTNEQIQEILRGKKPQYNGQSIIGHHTYNAMNYPHICNRGELIYPVTSREHLRGWHGGSYSKNAPGRPVNPNYLEEF
ncbi:T7SS effector LXG polymorphic toxin [Bacillus cereus]|uniref:T7SS effector LXG polymorphic toxin n=1 Tax=Bacillus cereus TaxID=1396 RepID=UPI000C283E1A|nr:T7SS effector LXG polymorphic toxin [Bacillus cereus]